MAMRPASSPRRGPPSDTPRRAVTAAHATTASAGASRAANWVTPATVNDADTSQ